MNRNDGYRTRALQAINEFWGAYFRPPTLREIMDLSGIPSTSTTCRVVEDLWRAGEIVLPNGGTGKSRMPVPLWVKSAIQEADEKRGSIIATWDPENGWSSEVVK